MVGKKKVKIQGDSYISDIAELLYHPPMLRKRGLNLKKYILY
jgi:hypothetical protein